MTIKKIILCADDYAQNEYVSDGILDLLEKKRLSAVSCMTTTPLWEEYSKKILPFNEKVDIGLHFDLTKDISVEKLLIKSMLRCINKKQIKEDLHHQIDLFISHMGRNPDFIDGHQHVHVFPQIRSAFIEVLNERFKDDKPYIRSIYNMDFITDIKLKAAILKLVSFRFKKLLQKNSFLCNKYFSGIYSFNNNPSSYRGLMQKWLEKSQQGTLIMCHPGKESSNIKDPIRNARLTEYNYLMSDNFLNDLKNYSVVF